MGEAALGSGPGSVAARVRCGGRPVSVAAELTGHQILQLLLLGMASVTLPPSPCPCCHCYRWAWRAPQRWSVKSPVAASSEGARETIGTILPHLGIRPLCLWPGRRSMLS